MKDIEKLNDNELKKIIESNDKVTLLSIIEVGLSSLNEIASMSEAMQEKILKKLKKKILLRLEFISLDKIFCSSMLLKNIDELMKGFHINESEESIAKRIIKKQLTWYMLILKHGLVEGF